MSVHFSIKITKENTDRVLRALVDFEQYHRNGAGDQMWFSITKDPGSFEGMYLILEYHPHHPRIRLYDENDFKHLYKYTDHKIDEDMKQLVDKIPQIRYVRNSRFERRAKKLEGNIDL